MLRAATALALLALLLLFMAATARAQEEDMDVGWYIGGTPEPPPDEGIGWTPPRLIQPGPEPVYITFALLFLNPVFTGLVVTSGVMFIMIKRMRLGRD